MAWLFECPVDGCEYSRSANDQETVIDSARQHTRDAHDEGGTREAVEGYVLGPG